MRRIRRRQRVAHDDAAIAFALKHRIGADGLQIPVRNVRMGFLHHVHGGEHAADAASESGKQRGAVGDIGPEGHVPFVRRAPQGDGLVIRGGEAGAMRQAELEENAHHGFEFLQAFGIVRDEIGEHRIGVERARQRLG